jgi:hypothetical protein
MRALGFDDAQILDTLREAVGGAGTASAADASAADASAETADAVSEIAAYRNGGLPVESVEREGI